MELRSGYKQTEVGVIPEEWEVKSLAKIADPKRPISYGIVQTGRPVRNGVKCVRVIDLEKGRVCTDNLITTSAEISAAYGRTLLAKGDLVIALRGKIGEVALIDDHLVGANLTRGVALIAPLEGYDSEYLLHYLSSSSSKQIFEKNLNGSALQEIPIATLRKIPAVTPHLPEQRAIAAALSDVDALIGALDRLIAKKRGLKQAAMQQLLTGQTRLPGFSERWNIVKASDIGRFRGGSGFPIKFQGDTSGEYPFFKVSDMNNEGNETFMETANNYINEALRKQLYVTAFPAKSIVFAKVGAAVFLERKKILVHASCLDNNMAAFILDADRANFRFIHYILLNTKLGDLVSTTALPSLSGTVLAEIELALPPIPEQTAIATILSDMDAEITALEARRDKTRALKQGIMQELLTGRVRLI